jgi:hypothetical protein
MDGGRTHDVEKHRTNTAQILPRRVQNRYNHGTKKSECNFISE